MKPRPLNGDEIALYEMGWQASGLADFAIATIEACGPTRPACLALLRTATIELLRLSVAHGDAEDRIARRRR